MNFCNLIRYSRVWGFGVLGIHTISAEEYEKQKEEYT